MHPLEASRALKRVSAHIQMADGARVPGVRMVADGAWVRVDIATNKEQCQDKETQKGGPVNKKKRSRPVVTGQRAAQRKNSPRQWGRPFGRAPREICPAISTHPHWGGDCTTTLRWQDVGAEGCVDSRLAPALHTNCHCISVLRQVDKNVIVIKRMGKFDWCAVV